MCSPSLGLHARVVIVIAETLNPHSIRGALAVCYKNF